MKNSNEDIVIVLPNGWKIEFLARENSKFPSGEELEDIILQALNGYMFKLKTLN